MFRPDYGLQLVREGVKRDVDIRFYGFRIFSLTILSVGQYSTFGERQHNGKWHAVSVDFDEGHFQRIIANAAPGIRIAVAAELSRDPATARTIEFEGEIVCDLRVRLGEPQQNADELYVPLVVEEVL